MTNQGQGDSSLEESVSPLEEVEHDDKTEDKETVEDEVIKVEVTEGSSFSGTRVSAFRETLQSLQCKIFKYTFLGQYPMNV